MSLRKPNLSFIPRIGDKRSVYSKEKVEGRIEGFEVNSEWCSILISVPGAENPIPVDITDYLRSEFNLTHITAGDKDILEELVGRHIEFNLAEEEGRVLLDFEPYRDILAELYVNIVHSDLESPEVMAAKVEEVIRGRTGCSDDIGSYVLQAIEGTRKKFPFINFDQKYKIVESIEEGVGKFLILVFSEEDSHLLLKGSFEARPLYLRMAIYDEYETEDIYINIGLGTYLEDFETGELVPQRYLYRVGKWVIREGVFKEVPLDPEGLPLLSDNLPQEGEQKEQQISSSSVFTKKSD